MLHIGIVGLGGISEKAYLPVMRQTPQVHWHLSTRRPERLTEVAQLFGQATTYATWQDLLDIGLDGVFIHVATDAHAEIAREFLAKGVPVYIDKPVVDDYATTLALYRLADEAGTWLMAGFNRRFAPKVQQLKQLVDKRRIVSEKHETNGLGPLRHKLFDYFIHPLDTALHLLDEPLVAGGFHYHLIDGLVSQVTATCYSERTSVVVSMNLQSGSRQENISVQTPEESVVVTNLETLARYRGDTVIHEHFGSWTPTLQKRGFEAAINAFLTAIQGGVNPVSPESSLLSHYICEQIAQSTSGAGVLDVRLPD